MKIVHFMKFIVTAVLLMNTLPAYSLEDHKFGKKPLFVPGEVIVKMKPNARLNANNLSTLGIQADTKLTSGGEIIYHIQASIMGALSANEAQDKTLQVVKKLKQDPNVEYAQPNYIMHIMKAPNDTLYSKQWHYFNYGSGPGESLGGIDLPKAWDVSTGSSNVVVAVIDTGILPNHEDIAGSPNLVAGYDMITDTFQANDGDGRDADATDPGDAIKKGECFMGIIPEKDQPNSWHGTHVAGTIGVGKTDNNLGVAGINWKVKVQPVRVLGKCGGSTTDINDGIRWAAGLNVPGVPANPTPVKVINMSLGGAQACSDSPATQQAINDAVNAGVTVVVAAGNESKDASGFTPSGCDNVITVAAADPSGKLTSFSNWGESVEILAPGGLTKSCENPENGILSMVKTSDDRGNCGVSPAYAYYNGTSMAAPHVAGVAALWLAQDPSLTPSQLSAKLQAKARPRNSSECPKPCGAGLLTAFLGDDDGGPTPTEEFGLTFSPDKASYQPNDTVGVQALLKADGEPQADKTVSFSPSNTEVATVSPSSAVTNAEGIAAANVTATGNGEAIISAESEGKQTQKAFRVQSGELSISMLFNPDKPLFNAGETTQAVASVKIGNAAKDGQIVKFSSDNPSVAAVSANSGTTNAQGKANVTVLTKAKGTAKITAEADGKKVEKTISVPDLSLTTFVILLLSIIGIGVFQQRKAA